MSSWYSTLLQSLLGGALIGVASVLLLWSSGKIAGISGIIQGLLNYKAEDYGWRWLFLLGMLFGGVVVFIWMPHNTALFFESKPGVLVTAGLLVGLGTTLGSGCTSGHGICGISRRSPRSIIATVIFMIAGMVTVFFVRHW